MLFEDVPLVEFLDRVLTSMHGGVTLSVERHEFPLLVDSPVEASDCWSFVNTGY